MSRLPPSLAPWAASLGDLDPVLVTDLGPMIHRLDELVGRLDVAGGEDGVPDGYDGTTNRGDPERLLVGEWLLAEELPLEFMRRAAEGELSFLKRSYPHQHQHGRVLAVVDSGPDQIGAGRLVQLAALIVLDRRARAAGTELSLAVLQSGGEPRTGSLDLLVPAWLHSRSSALATPGQVAARLSDQQPGDRMWFIGGPALGALVRGHRRVIRSQVVGWQPSRASTVALRVADSACTLELPHPGASIRALRGEGLLARHSSPGVRVADTGRGASFNSNAKALLWRGRRDDELYASSPREDAGPARVKHHRLPGAVLAAAVMSRRVVAVVTDGHAAWVHVIGKHLAKVHEIRFDLSLMGLDSDGVRKILDAPVRPVHLMGSDLLVQVDQSWWLLSVEDGASETSYLAVAPGTALDCPRHVRRFEGRTYCDGHFVQMPSDAAVVLGPPGWVAWSIDSRHWNLMGQRDPGARVELDIGDADDLAALVLVDQMPALVAISPSRRLVRVVSPRSARTLTRWSGPAQYDVHPLHPWLVRSTPEGIKVGDLGSGDTLLTIKVDS